MKLETTLKISSCVSVFWAIGPIDSLKEHFFFFFFANETMKSKLRANFEDVSLEFNRDGPC